MKRSLALTIAAAALFPALLASPARADLLGFKVGGHAGISHTGGDIDDSSPIYGGVARLEVLSLITGELAVDYKKDSVEINGQKGDISTVPIQLSALITFLPIVYGTIGVGWYNVSANDDITDQVSELDNISQAALHLGVGAEIPISNRLYVTGDLRYVFLDYNLDNVSSDVFDSSASFTTFTGGLLFKLF
jgi:hypothetical protein